MLLIGGYWYASAVALDKIAKIPNLVGSPVHKTPDGRAVLVYDTGGAGSIVNGVKSEPRPPCLVPQNQSGHDLMVVVFDKNGGSPQAVRVTLDVRDLPDLARLVEFDHLPEARKQGAVEEGLHKPGDRLA